MAKVTNPPSKRIGGLERAEKARQEMKLILTNERHPLYFAKDIEFARRYDVTRHTIYKIRDTLGILSRSERLLKKLKSTDTKQFTLKELSQMLRVKYQNLYKIILENEFQVKPDVAPITHLKKYQAANKGKKKKPKK
jgi:predicted transcriptional regulator